MKLAVVFDLDGTLIDTPRGIVETFIATFNSMGIDFNDRAAIRSTIGLPLEQAFSGILGVERDDELVLQAVAQYLHLFKEIVLPKAKDLVFPGVAAGLANLQTNGLTLAVATSKFYTNAELLLRAAGIWDNFTLVVGADQVKHPKPHPEMGRLVMKKLGVLPENTLMVGDTTHDLLMARDAGMRSIAVTYGIHDTLKLNSANPTWIADNFNQVEEIIYKGLSIVKRNHFSRASKIAKIKSDIFSINRRLNR